MTQEGANLGLCERSLSALSLVLGDKAYLMGQALTGVDAIAFGILAGIMTPFFEAPMRDLAIGYPNLAAYVDRMMARFYPDFAWTSVSEVAQAA